MMTKQNPQTITTTAVTTNIDDEDESVHHRPSDKDNDNNNAVRSLLEEQQQEENTEEKQDTGTSTSTSSTNQNEPAKTTTVSNESGIGGRSDPYIAANNKPSVQQQHQHHQQQPPIAPTMSMIETTTTTTTTTSTTTTHSYEPVLYKGGKDLTCPMGADGTVVIGIATVEDCFEKCSEIERYAETTTNNSHNNDHHHNGCNYFAYHAETGGCVGCHIDGNALKLVPQEGFQAYRIITKTNTTSTVKTSTTNTAPPPPATVFPTAVTLPKPLAPETPVSTNEIDIPTLDDDRYHPPHHTNAAAEASSSSSPVAALWLWWWVLLGAVVVAAAAAVLWARCRKQRRRLGHRHKTRFSASLAPKPTAVPPMATFSRKVLLGGLDMRDTELRAGAIHGILGEYKSRLDEKSGHSGHTTRTRTNSNNSNSHSNRDEDDIEFRFVGNDTERSRMILFYDDFKDEDFIGDKERKIVRHPWEASVPWGSEEESLDSYDALDRMLSERDYLNDSFSDDDDDICSSSSDDPFSPTEPSLRSLSGRRPL